MSVDHAYPYYKEIVALTADFVVCKGDKVEEVYQVSYDLTKEKTRAREIRGLLTASKHTRCDNLFLITDVERSEFEQEGKLIKIIPAYDWLLQ
jgi:predicted AAA+ superfamily ATPase